MEKVIFLEAEPVYLRILNETDLTDRYLQWLNDEEVSRFNSHAVFPNTPEKMRQFYDSINPQKQVVLAIIERTSDLHVGNVSLQAINWINRSAEFAILLGDKNFWGKGIGHAASQLIVKYGFERLNLHRIYCGTIAGNTGMEKLAQKLRMIEEGRRREAVYKNGTYHDVIEYGVLREEYLK